MGKPPKFKLIDYLVGVENVGAVGAAVGPVAACVQETLGQKLLVRASQVTLTTKEAGARDTHFDS